MISESILLSLEWNSMRLGGHAHGIVTKTVHKTLPGGGKIISKWHYVDRSKSALLPAETKFWPR